MQKIPFFAVAASWNFAWMDKCLRFSFVHQPVLWVLRMHKGLSHSLACYPGHQVKDSPGHRYSHRLKSQRTLKFVVCRSLQEEISFVKEIFLNKADDSICSIFIEQLENIQEIFKLETSRTLQKVMWKRKREGSYFCCEAATYSYAVALLGMIDSRCLYVLVCFNNFAK